MLHRVGGDFLASGNGRARKENRIATDAVEHRRRNLKIRQLTLFCASRPTVRDDDIGVLQLSHVGAGGEVLIQE
jgi:hypothetical protein